jgi:hypothetical protein
MENFLLKFPRISIYDLGEAKISKSILNFHPRNLTFTTNNLNDNLIVAYIKNESEAKNKNPPFFLI